MPTKTTTTSTTSKKTEEAQVTPSLTIDSLIGENTVNSATENQVPDSETPVVKQAPILSAPTYNNMGNKFNGLVDNRIIPDAGVPTESVEGVLDLEVNGHGLLRPEFAPSNRDVYISTSQIRRFRLRPGDWVKGPARKPKESERYWGLLQVTHVCGIEVDKLQQRVQFDRLVPVYPNRQLNLTTKPEVLSTRLIDLVAPIGRGQRGMIVSPPKAGKTTIMKEIANGITTNHPDVYLMAVLVGERPEEATDIARSIKGEVASSNFDEPPERQVKVAELALERAKRLVELGNHVVILLDSITRLARAYNLAIPTSGRTLSGGFDPAALYPPKRFFGAARNFEEFETYEGKRTGSLTIIGTALVDTGSRMDDLIYEEFKGTGNMELHLDRTLAERRIYPAIDIQKSGTRMDHIMYDKKTYAKIKTLMTMIDMLGANERTEILMERLKKTKDNQEFLDSLRES
jgi:transcription termination factor Rho